MYERKQKKTTNGERKFLINFFQQQKSLRKVGNIFKKSP